MGGILTLLAVASFKARTSSPAQVVSLEKKSEVVSEVGARVPQRAAASKTEPSETIAPELWSYLDRPAGADALESALPAPADEIYYARVDRQRLAAASSPLAQPGSRFEMTLPDGQVVPVVVAASESLGAERYVTEATIEGSEHGRAVFAYNEGELSATIDDIDLGSWQVRAVGDSIAQVYQVNPASLAPCGNTEHHHSKPHQAATPEITSLDEGAGAAALGSAPVAGAEGTSYAVSITGSWPTATLLSSSLTEVRVLVPYSKALLKSVSSASIRSQIDLGMAAMNNNLKRSGVNVRVSLAGAPAVEYKQEYSGDATRVLDVALTRLANSIDGILDNVHVLRSQAKADLVIFLTARTDTTNSGVGYLLKTPGDIFNATWAFSAVNYSQMHAGATFCHELGHNFGCNHDRSNARTTAGVTMSGSYSYSYGHRFKGSNGSTYRTIMAYAPGGVVPYFSNPKIKVNGAAAGVNTGSSGEAYNALTIQKNAAEVSRYDTNRIVLRIFRRLSS